MATSFISFELNLLRRVNKVTLPYFTLLCKQFNWLSNIFCIKSIHLHIDILKIGNITKNMKLIIEEHILFYKVMRTLVEIGFTLIE